MSAPAPPAPFSVGLPVPELLWTTFEQVFTTKIRSLAKDIAKTLGTSDAPLLAELVKGRTVAPYVLEESADTELETRCDILVQHPDTPKFLRPCGQAIVWSATPCHRCAEHLYTVPPVQPRLPVLTSLEDQEELYRSEDGTVYDKDFVVRGRFDFPTKRLLLAVLEE
jgi:hypothetical protein